MRFASEFASAFQAHPRKSAIYRACGRSTSSRRQSEKAAPVGGNIRSCGRKGNPLGVSPDPRNPAYLRGAASVSASVLDSAVTRAPVRQVEQ